MRGLSGLDYWYPPCHNQILKAKTGTIGDSFVLWKDIKSLGSIVASWSMLLYCRMDDCEGREECNLIPASLHVITSRVQAPTSPLRHRNLSVTHDV